VPGFYDLPTVLLSFLTASFAGFVAFEAVEHSRESHHPGIWSTTGGLMLGLGIWSMHFIGMLASRPPFQRFYSLEKTLLSVLFITVASILSVRIISRTVPAPTLRQHFTSIWGTTAMFGSGVAAMHYVGMEALRFSVRPVFMAGRMIAFLLVSFAVSFVAVLVLRRAASRGLPLVLRVAAALTFGAGICAMHYTGMSAMMLPAGAHCIQTPWSFKGPVLARIGAGNAAFFALCLLILLYHDKARWSRLAHEAELRALDVTRRAERLATAGRMSASIAHEINNPLEAVTNLLFLLECSPLSEDNLACLHRAQQELKRIADITTHTLKFYRQSSGPEPTSVPELFESCLTLFEKRLRESSITVNIVWPPELPSVLCRSSEIRQVLANLVGNAIDAMTPCSTLNPAATGTDGGTLQLSIRASHSGLFIQVSDTGKGIPDELHERILEPFFTTKGVAGTGLGLSISAEILHRHGGQLTFTSRTAPGPSGTCFEVFIPYGEVAIMPQSRGSDALYAADSLFASAR
jgi:signal transduction histidine kinase